MSDTTNGRGLAADEFDEDEIDWDDHAPSDATEPLSPIEQMVEDSMNVVVTDDDAHDPDEFDEDA